MDLDPVFEINCGYGEIYRTGFSFDGKILASSHISGTLAFWDIDEGKQISTHNAHGNISVRCLAWSPGNLHIASGDTDGNIIIWDFGLGEEIKRIDRAHSSRVRSIAWSPDGTKIVTGSSDGYVKTWDVSSGKLLSQSKDILTGKDQGRPTVHSVKWSPDGRQLASCLENKCIIWDAVTYEKEESLDGHTEKVRSVTWSKDGELFATCSNDRTIIIWDAKSWKITNTLKLQDPDLPIDTCIFCIHFSPNSDFIVSKSTDNSVRIWRLRDRMCLIRIEELCGIGLESDLGGISFHQELPYLVTLRNNCKNLRIWELDYDFLSKDIGYYFIDQGLKSSVSHKFDFSEPFGPTADVAILSYFGKIIRDKFPNKDISFQIIQERRSITLRIESDEKDLRSLEFELSQYGKVVMGQIPVEAYLKSKLEILELKTQLQLKDAMNENLKMINEHRSADFNQLVKVLTNTIELSQRPNITYSLTPTDQRSIDEIIENIRENIELFGGYINAEKPKIDIEHIAKIIEKDIENGLEALKEIAKSEENLDLEIYAVASRYSRNKINFNNGNIKYEDYEITLNKITSSILEIVKSISNPRVT